jgi:heme-degrading monooxygenase HmoA
MRKNKNIIMRNIIITEQQNQPLTFINHWTLESAIEMNELITFMKAEMDWMSSKKGFIALALLPSEDGKNLVIYAQWESRTDFDEAIATNPEAEEKRKQMLHLGTPSGNIYSVDSIFYNAK